ncbi:MAG: hypothetical protein ACLVAW_17785 [Eisenbergiella massiliensis]
MEVEDNVSPEIERIIAELQKLKGMTIHVGIQNGNAKGAAGEEKDTPADILTIAGVHEFGATIKAKNVSNLAIPIADKAIGKARDEDFSLSVQRRAICLDASVLKERVHQNKLDGRKIQSQDCINLDRVNLQKKMKRILNIFLFSSHQWIYQNGVL